MDDFDGKSLLYDGRDTNDRDLWLEEPALWTNLRCRYAWRICAPAPLAANNTVSPALVRSNLLWQTSEDCVTENEARHPAWLMSDRGTRGVSVGVSERRVICTMSFRSPDKACVAQECANERADGCHGGGNGARERQRTRSLRPFTVD